MPPQPRGVQRRIVRRRAVAAASGRHIGSGAEGQDPLDQGLLGPWADGSVGKFAGKPPFVLNKYETNLQKEKVLTKISMIGENALLNWFLMGKWMVSSFDFPTNPLNRGNLD